MTDCMNFTKRQPALIPEFYASRNIFITGGTGFIGQALIEKILRSCPEVGNIYVLIRYKKNESPQKRIRNLLQMSLFENLQQHCPHQLDKVIPIEGNLVQHNLGMSEEDQLTIHQSVSVVFHSAATVKFNESLKTAIDINLVGTKNLLELCKRMTQLKAIVHVSTAYCNCDKREVEEIVYDPPFDPEKIINLVQLIDEEKLNKITPILLGEYPNTYTFTKAITEYLIASSDLPIVIVRPSIVVSSIREPVPGWLQNWNGPTGLISAAYTGVLRTSNCMKDCISDLVPVDIVVNLMIAVSWNLAVNKSNKIVYHCCTGSQNPITWGTWINKSMEVVRNYPLKDTLWYPGGWYFNNTFVHRLAQVFLHFVPSYLYDSSLHLLGKQSNMVGIQNKLQLSSLSIEFFTQRDWIFRDNNTRLLYENLPKADRELFNFDVRQFDWDYHIKHYILGIRTYLYKETLNDLPNARSRLAKLLWIQRFGRLVSLFLFLRTMLRNSKKFRILYAILISIIFRIYRMIPYI